MINRFCWFSANRNRKPLANKIEGDFINFLILIGIDLFITKYRLIQRTMQTGLVAAVNNRIKEDLIRVLSFDVYVYVSQ